MTLGFFGRAPERLYEVTQPTQVERNFLQKQNAHVKKTL